MCFVPLHSLHFNHHTSDAIQALVICPSIIIIINRMQSNIPKKLLSLENYLTEAKCNHSLITGIKIAVLYQPLTSEIKMESLS